MPVKNNYEFMQKGYQMYGSGLTETLSKKSVQLKEKAKKQELEKSPN